MKLPPKDFKYVHFRYLNKELSKMYGVTEKQIWKWRKAIKNKKCFYPEEAKEYIKISKENNIPKSFFKDFYLIDRVELKKKYKIGEQKVNDWARTLGLLSKTRTKIPASFEMNYEDYSIIELAEKYGKHKTTISNWVRILGLKNKYAKHSKEDIEAMLPDFYEMHFKDFSKKYKISTSFFYRKLKEYGFPRKKEYERINSKGE